MDSARANCSTSWLVLAGSTHKVSVIRYRSVSGARFGFPGWYEDLEEILGVFYCDHGDTLPGRYGPASPKVEISPRSHLSSSNAVV
jgi:hypothetical protein